MFASLGDQVGRFSDMFRHFARSRSCFLCIFPHWHCHSGALSHTMCVNEFLLKPFKSQAFFLCTMESDWIIFSTVSLGLISILNWTYGCVGVPMIPSFPIIGSIIQPPRPETGVATALDFMLGLDGETPIVGLVKSLRILGTWSGGSRRGKQWHLRQHHKDGRNLI